MKVQKKYQHYFVDWKDSACVECGLNWRYLNEEPFCEKNTEEYKWDRKLISGRRIIEADNHNAYKLKRGHRLIQISWLH